MSLIPRKEYKLPPGGAGAIEAGKVIELALILYDAERKNLFAVFPTDANDEENAAIMVRFGMFPKDQA